MKDDAYLDVDHDPSTFLSYLLERLSTIPGSTWKAEPSPWHTTYDDWHVLGSVSLPAGTLKEGKQIAGSSISGAADTEETVHKHGDQIYRVAARVSKHSLRLERQFQLNKSILVSKCCQAAAAVTDCPRMSMTHWASAMFVPCSSSSCLLVRQARLLSP